MENAPKCRNRELKTQFIAIVATVVAYFVYFIDVGVLSGVGEDVESGIQLVKHSHDFHNSVGTGIAGT